MCSNCTGFNAYNFGATTSDCEVSPGPLLVNQLPWASGALINVNWVGFPSSFQGITTSAVVSTVIVNWNTALQAITPCAGVALTTKLGNGATATLSWATLPLGQRGSTNFQTATFVGGRLWNVTSQISNLMSSPNAVAEVISHEWGHTFGLDDCNGCILHSTTMVINTPDPNDTSYNQLIGLPGPTSCDFSTITGRPQAQDYLCNQGEANVKGRVVARAAGPQRSVLDGHVTVRGDAFHPSATSLLLLRPSSCPLGVSAEQSVAAWWDASVPYEHVADLAEVSARVSGHHSAAISLHGVSGALLVDPSGRVLKAWIGELSVDQYGEFRRTVTRLTRRGLPVPVYTAEGL